MLPIGHRSKSYKTWQLVTWWNDPTIVTTFLQSWQLFASLLRWPFGHRKCRCEIPPREIVFIWFDLIWFNNGISSIHSRSIFLAKLTSLQSVVKILLVALSESGHRLRERGSSPATRVGGAAQTLYKRIGKSLHSTTWPGPLLGQWSTEAEEEI